MNTFTGQNKKSTSAEISQLFLCCSEPTTTPDRNKQQTVYAPVSNQAQCESLYQVIYCLLSFYLCVALALHKHGAFCDAQEAACEKET